MGIGGRRFQFNLRGLCLGNEVGEVEVDKGRLRCKAPHVTSAKGPSLRRKDQIYLA
jgi:hypothetical protein